MAKATLRRRPVGSGGARGICPGCAGLAVDEVGNGPTPELCPDCRAAYYGAAGDAVDPVAVQCRGCGYRFDMDDSVRWCPRCGGEALQRER